MISSRFSFRSVLPFLMFVYLFDSFCFIKEGFYYMDKSAGILRLNRHHF